MTSVEKLTHIKDGKKVRSHLVYFPHYEVQGEAKVASILHQGYSNHTIFGWLDNHSSDFSSAGELLLDLLDWDGENCW